MNLPEKIIMFRKQRGWSQEELAQRMDVSRQSVSKWESGASVPDIDKIILLSQIFETTTDYLLKDDMGSGDISDSDSRDTENSDIFYREVKNKEEDTSSEARYVSSEEAEEYIRLMKSICTKIATGVFLCICSPVPMMFLLALHNLGLYHVTEDMAGIVGVCIIIVIVAVAVCLFVSNGIKINKWEFIEKEVITLDSSVIDKYKEESEKYAPIFARNLTVGVVLCVISVIPLLAATVKDNEGVIVAMVGVLLILVACGVYRFVKFGMIKESYDKLLEQGEYTKQKKRNNKKNDAFAGVYWLIITAIYIAYSFTTNNWEHSWIIWPVAGVLFAAVMTIINSVRNKE